MTRDTDPQVLRDASTAWREMGRQLEEMVRDLNNGVRSAREHDWRGPSAEAFDEDWAQLRQVVDEALPVFRMAADELDGAAEVMAGSDVATRVDSAETISSGGVSGESAGVVPASSSGSSSDSSGAADLRGGGGYQAMFAVSALSQMGVMLGSTFGRRGGGGGQSSGSRLARSEAQPASTLPRSADLFGSGAGAPADDRRRGGLGIARGKRQPARSGEPAAAPDLGERQAAAVRFGGPEPEPSATKPEEPSPLDRPINRSGGGDDRPDGTRGSDGTRGMDGTRGSDGTRGTDGTRAAAGDSGEGPAKDGDSTTPAAGEPRDGAADREPTADSGDRRTASGTPDSGGEGTASSPNPTGERPAGEDRPTADGRATGDRQDAGDRGTTGGGAVGAPIDTPATPAGAPPQIPESGPTSDAPTTGSPATATPATPAAERPEGPGARLTKAGGVEREEETGRTGPAGEDTADGREPKSRQVARPGGFG